MNWYENYGTDDGVVRATVDYDADHAFSGVWECGVNDEIDAAGVARTELGEAFVEPLTSEDVDKIGRELEHRAELAEDEADTTTDDTEALALLRRARNLRKAGEALRVSDETRCFFSQIMGDDEVEWARELLAAWDEAHGDRSWSEEDDEMTGAVTAYERALRGSRSGFTQMVVEATDEWLTISFSGYSCDISDVSLVVRRGETVDALLTWATDATLGQVDEALRIDAEHPGALNRALWCLSVALTEPDADDLLEAARLLGPVDHDTMHRVVQTLNALEGADGNDWSGNFSELVRASAHFALVG
jgi:hypothetical protein